MFEIYALIDPKSSKIRYIGYTSHSKRRLSYHLQACKNTREKKAEYIK